MRKIGYFVLAVSVVLVFGCKPGPQEEATQAPEEAHEEHEAHEVHWGYEGEQGPQNWGSLKPEYALCGEGKSQSPINIANAQEAELAEIKFSYNDSGLKIINNGHTIQINYAPGSTVEIGGKTYDLLQFHFHTPSEHTVDGNAYNMEMHLVHKNAEGELAVVGVFMQEGASNPIIETLWSNLPEKENEEKDVSAVQINAANLLPADKAYYHYSGSLTTPPCSEAVNWNVLKTPVEVSSEQVATFAAIFKANARPVQPLNDRVLQVSKSAK